MADSPDLPGERAWRVGPDGRLPLEYWKFLRDLVTYVRQTQGNTSSLADIDARLDALEAASASAIDGQHSVQVSQQDAETIIRLVGDLAVPGAGRYYGTSADGARGWFERLLSSLRDVDFTTPPATGDVLVYDVDKWKPTPPVVSEPCVSACFDGGGVDVEVGKICLIPMRFGVELTGLTIASSSAGDITIDVKVNGVSIAAAAPPELVASNYATDNTLSGWDTTIPEGSVLSFVVTDCAGIDFVSLVLEGTRL